MLPVNDFNAYIKQHALFVPGNKLLLAVSGGRDSVLMAHLFKQAGFDFSIAHCNFNLRGDESQRDETFVHLLAADLEVPFFLKHFDTKEYAASEGISTQMAARQLRYNWFETLRAEGSFDLIAVAHHQDDAIETILINLVRGTGIGGLHGISPKKGHLIRPMLFLTASDIDQLITENVIAYVEDSSNLLTSYMRNKIRLNVIPHLRDINPALTETFAQNISLFTETEMVLQQAVKSLQNKICKALPDGFVIDIRGIKQLEPQKLLLFELLRPYNFTDPVVDELLASLNKQSGTSFYSTSHRVTLNRDHLLITPVETAAAGVVLWHSNTDTIVFHQQKISLTVTGQLPWQFNPAHAYIDFEQLIFPLIVRNWQQGDTFVPLGMNGSKKLSDFFIDSKVPLPVKQNIPILINGNSQVIWVGGLRQDERYKVTTATKKVAIFELEK